MVLGIFNLCFLTFNIFRMTNSGIPKRIAATLSMKKAMGNCQEWLKVKLLILCFWLILYFPKETFYANYLLRVIENFGWKWINDESLRVWWSGALCNLGRIVELQSLSWFTAGRTNEDFCQDRIHCSQSKNCRVSEIVLAFSLFISFILKTYNFKNKKSHVHSVMSINEDFLPTKHSPISMISEIIDGASMRSTISKIQYFEIKHFLVAIFTPLFHVIKIYYHAPML